MVGRWDLGCDVAGERSLASFGDLGGKLVTITVSLYSLGATVLGTVGLVLIGLAAFAVLPEGGAWLGFALLFIGGFVWLHGQIDRVADRMARREDAAFNFGKLSAVHDHQRSSHDRV